MLHAFRLAMVSFTDAKIRKYLYLTILLTAIIFAILAFAMDGLIDWGLAYYGVEDSNIGAIIAALTLILSLWFLFRAIAVAILWVFADHIIDAVEARYYPIRAATGRAPTFASGISLGLRSVGRMIIYNLLMIPIYIMLLFTAIGPAVAFLLVNGLLMGRDLEDMVAFRHQLDDKDMGWRMPKMQRLALGVMGTAALAVPIVGFFAPIIAISAATHLLHRQQSGH
ncbi:hypothetical protein LPB140_01325 [Sphingorhabdus lutea]|uniref:EI24 domain-containing protein n=1 Tax=Sphingorhabdus lutea TaxID=1913578 RepID=A0A1L3J993_9SPHN|nr:EI24 domain-containing protein [Sphingorhabdus lutea]APG61699.1 hypothetical protein LPB140_01325 [Sphingorhabdus lutea]